MLIRQGRTNFAKCISKEDPATLRQFKCLLALRPMPIVSAKPAAESSPPDMSQALLIRKGRNSLQAAAGDGKDTLDAAIEQFRESMQKQTELVRTQTLGYTL